MRHIKNNSWIIFLLLFLSASLQIKSAEALPPDFEAKDMAGRTVKLSDFKGKVVLLDFWATWCPPCRVEVPNLLAIYRQFKNNDFVLISISLDRDTDAARKFVKDKEMNWVHIIDQETCSRIAGLYEIESIPATFIIDAKGKIIARRLRGAELKNKISALLE